LTRASPQRDNENKEEGKRVHSKKMCPGIVNFFYLFFFLFWGGGALRIVLISHPNQNRGEDTSTKKNYNFPRGDGDVHFFQNQKAADLAKIFFSFVADLAPISGIPLCHSRRRHRNGTKNSFPERKIPSRRCETSLPTEGKCTKGNEKLFPGTKKYFPARKITSRRCGTSLPTEGECTKTERKILSRNEKNRSHRRGSSLPREAESTKSERKIRSRNEKKIATAEQKPRFRGSTPRQ
jgi:hypothetical protein